MIGLAVELFPTTRITLTEAIVILCTVWKPTMINTLQCLLDDFISTFFAVDEVSIFNEVLWVDFRQPFCFLFACQTSIDSFWDYDFRLLLKNIVLTFLVVIEFLAFIGVLCLWHWFVNFWGKSARIVAFVLKVWRCDLWRIWKHCTVMPSSSEQYLIRAYLVECWHCTADVLWAFEAEIRHIEYSDLYGLLWTWHELSVWFDHVLRHDKFFAHIKLLLKSLLVNVFFLIRPSFSQFT